MDKITFLTMALTALTPLHSFSSTGEEFSSAIIRGFAKHRDAKRPPPFNLPDDCTQKEGAALACTENKQSALACTENKQSALACTENKQSALACTENEQSYLMHSLLHKIVLHPKIDYFKNAFTQTNQVYCQISSNELHGKKLLVPLTKNDLRQLIDDIKDLIDHYCLLRPSTEAADQQPQVTTTGPASLKTIQKLYNNLAET